MKLIAVIGIAVNAALAVIALVYTIETRKLRKQNQSQLDLLRKQAKRAIAPYLLGAVARVPAPKAGFVCLVENLTKNLALNVLVFTFDHVSQELRSSRSGREFLKGYTVEEFQMSEAYSQLDLAAKLEEVYKCLGRYQNFNRPGLPLGGQKPDPIQTIDGIPIPPTPFSAHDEKIEEVTFDNTQLNEGLTFFLRGANPDDEISITYRPGL